MPRWVEKVATDGFDAYGQELLEIFNEDRPLTRELLARLKCFVHVGDGAWFMCSSGPTSTANGGMVLNSTATTTRRPYVSFSHAPTHTRRRCSSSRGRTRRVAVGAGAIKLAHAAK